MLMLLQQLQQPLQQLLVMAITLRNMRAGTCSTFVPVCKRRWRRNTLPDLPDACSPRYPLVCECACARA